MVGRRRGSEEWRSGARAAAALRAAHAARSASRRRPSRGFLLAGRDRAPPRRRLCAHAPYLLAHRLVRASHGAVSSCSVRHAWKHCARGCARRFCCGRVALTPPQRAPLGAPCSVRIGGCTPALSRCERAAAATQRGPAAGQEITDQKQREGLPASWLAPRRAAIPAPSAPPNPPPPSKWLAPSRRPGAWPLGAPARRAGLPQLLRRD